MFTIFRGKSREKIKIQAAVVVEGKEECFIRQEGKITTIRGQALPAMSAIIAVYAI
jgi:hypothetical protein